MNRAAVDGGITAVLLKDGGDAAVGSPGILFFIVPQDIKRTTGLEKF